MSKNFSKYWSIEQIKKPYLNYGILAWGNTHSTYTEKMLLLPKKALRVICNVPYRAHTNELFLNNNILKVQDLYNYQLGQFMYKLDNNSLPETFKSMFIKNKTIHSYSTRNSEAYHLPLMRTRLAKLNITFSGPKFWNNLDGTIKDSPSLNHFKNKLKNYLLCSYQAD